MIKYEENISLNQNLTFSYFEKVIREKGLELTDLTKRKLGLVTENNLYTNLSMLLSDQCPYIIQCDLYDGSNKLYFRDIREFKGSIIKQVDEFLKYLNLFNKISGTIVGLKRIDVEDYPGCCLKEILLNAVIHRDYYLDRNILISLFDDRIEILSPGGLVSNLTIDDIVLGNSVCRNPELSNIFFRLNYILNFGTGIGNTIKCYEKYGEKPVFKVLGNDFLTILPNINYRLEEKKGVTK